MADLNGFDANEVDPTTTFDPLPAGKYVAAVTESEMKPTKSGAGKYLQLTFQILEGEYKGTLLRAGRKPGEEEVRLDLAAATMIGDSARDVECGIRAGCGRTILVQSGLHDALPQLKAQAMPPNWVAPDLAAAVDWLLTRPGSMP